MDVYIRVGTPGDWQSHTYYTRMRDTTGQWHRINPWTLALTEGFAPPPQLAFPSWTGALSRFFVKEGDVLLGSGVTVAELADPVSLADAIQEVEGAVGTPFSQFAAEMANINTVPRFPTGTNLGVSARWDQNGTLFWDNGAGVILSGALPGLGHCGEAYRYEQYGRYDTRFAPNQFACGTPSSVLARYAAQKTRVFLHVPEAVPYVGRPWTYEMTGGSEPPTCVQGGFNCCNPANVRGAPSNCQQNNGILDPATGQSYYDVEPPDKGYRVWANTNTECNQAP